MTSFDMMSTFPLGQLRVRRSGYGAMQLAGSFAFGTPPDRVSALGVLRAAVAAGVDHIDTAQYYGPGAVNDLIRDALHPYPGGLAIVSKVAVRPADSGGVLRFGDPDQLRAGIEDNLRSLRAGQLATMVAARDEGLIAGVGLSNVRLDQLRHAAVGTDIVCVQNLFHLTDRRSAPVLQQCLSRGIAFVPFCPLAPNVLLIPGTGSVAHLRENLAAEGVMLDGQALRELDGLAGDSGSSR